MERSSGILLSVSSLPSKYGIGCFDESAYSFVDWLKAAGQEYWQILPLGPVSYGDSPYQSFSTYAGNPYYISLDEFVESGFMTSRECIAPYILVNDGKVDYHNLYKTRIPLLKKAYKNSGGCYEKEIEGFGNENKWLDDYALFMALKDKNEGKPFTEWKEDIRLRKTAAMEKYSASLAEEIGFYKFIQYFFCKQWKKLKEYANNSGIKIIGDIPIYVAADSADVWSNPELFKLDKSGRPTAVAGCPPDSFSETGQLWGNPLYDWKKHKEGGFKWWISRIEHCFKLYDVVRIDHFRGFDEYYSIPANDQTAENGHWEKGAGIELFRALENAIGKREIIAEDLGFVTDTVKKLVRDCGFPNMKVLQFGFDSRDTGSRNDYLPHNYTENSVAYTGTHDNQTLVSWFKTISEDEQKAAKEYMCDMYTPDYKLYKSFISLVMRSRSRLCVIPMQDWLGLSDESRMNTPSTVGNNWRWRMKSTDMSERLAAEIKKMTVMYGRKETK